LRGLAPKEALGLILAGAPRLDAPVRGSLSLAGQSALRRLPAGLAVTQRLDLSSCSSLTALPEDLHTGSLVVRDCRSLESLPEGLTTSFLDASNCTSLVRWPSQARIEHGHVILRNCAALPGLPSWLERVARLDLSGCVNVRSLPPGLEIHSFLDVAGSGLTGLPPSLRGVELRWRGVRIDERIAFHPETIRPEQVLSEPNAERRRVLIERLGYERFLEAVQPEVLDRDTDPGGPRSLLRVALQSDEPLVCLVVKCPSTARRYILRVPPSMESCHQAAAWIAGFDDPSLYRPVIET
jgi:hypothetical protein